MFELDDYFETPFEENKCKAYRKGSYGHALAGDTKRAINNKIQIGLIGLPESRNAYNGTFDTGVDEIRAYFYDLAIVQKVNVIDFGNLKLGKQVKDTYASVQYVTEQLVTNKVIPVFFGGSQDLTISIINAFNETQNETELTLIDSKIDALAEELHSHSFLSNFQNNILISVLAYQSYFNTDEVQKFAIANSLGLHRLGEVRNGFGEIEPVLRDSCIVSFDISSIRQSESPGCTFSSPNGLYAEEACQLANLSGLSDKLNVFSLFEYQADKDINGQSAHLSAQILWHFIYGVSQRKHDYPVKELGKYKKIYVRLEKIDADLVFYENVNNKRFWVEIPVSSSSTKVISCSQKDYQTACNNEIPDRIWQNISRYLK